MTDPAAETPQDGDAAPPPPKRFFFLRKRTVEGPAGDGPSPAPAEPDAPATDASGATPERIRPGVLRRRRRQLMGSYEQGIFDLGGLALELHSRGLLAEDVLRRRAAEVADIRGQVDELGVQLDEIRQARQERRQAGRGSTVACQACGARSRSTANFCSSCGASLQAPVAEADGGDADAQPDQPTTVIVDEQVTAVIIEVPEVDQPTTAIPPARGDGA